MYISLPSRLISSVGRTDLIARLRRIATDSGFSSGSQVSSWKPRKISSMCRPCASSKRQPVSSSATGFRYSMIRCRVGGDHAVADRLQRDLRALLLLEQRVLVELALGDVELDADQAAQAAAAVDARLGAAHHPAPVAVAVAHAVHALEHRRLARDVVADHRLHARQVVRMHEAAPVRRARSGRARRSRASSASAARNRPCCSRRRSPTGRRWRRAATARCAPRAARGGAGRAAARGRWRSSSRPASAAGAGSRPSRRAAATSTAP